MASTYSSLKIQLMATGENSGTWGDVTNTNLGTALEEAIVGYADATFASDGDLTLTLTNTNATQVARNFVLNVVSSVSLTATRNLIVPAIEKPYLIENNTTGSQSIVVKTASGTGVTVPNGARTFVYVNGTNVVPAVTFTPGLTTTTLTATGAITGTTSTFSGDGTYSGTGQVKMPAGTTAQRSGSPANGMLRYNSDTGSFEGYANSTWGGIGGAQAGGAIVTNKTTASASYTIATGENGFSVGPVSVNSGVTITISSGQRWLVV